MNTKYKKMKINNLIQFSLLLSAFCFLLFPSVFAQDTLYVWKAGDVIYKRAINQIDTIIFIPPATPPAPCTGTVSDLSGYIYNVVQIGTQCWMKENLKTRRYNDNVVIDHLPDNVQWSLNTIGAMSYPDNDPNNATPLGAYYNWYAVMTGKLCPTGWHVPTLEEWDALERYLIAAGYNWDGATSGNKIAKSMAAISPGNRGTWSETIMDGTPGSIVDYGEIIRNSTGFTVHPAGSREANGIFGVLGLHSYFWCYSPDIPWLKYMMYMTVDLGGYNTQKGNGLSVRCLRDN